MHHNINQTDYYVSRTVTVGDATVTVYRPKHLTDEQRAQVEIEVKAALASYGRHLRDKEGGAHHVPCD